MKSGLIQVLVLIFNNSYFHKIVSGRFYSLNVPLKEGIDDESM